MQKYSNNIINQYGAPIAGASVKILSIDGSLALIYSDNNSSLLTNPTISDEYGQFSFYAKNGRYSIAIEKQGVISQTLQDVLLDDLSDSSGNIVISAAEFTSFSVGGIERIHLNAAGDTTFYGDVVLNQNKTGASSMLIQNTNATPGNNASLYISQGATQLRMLASYGNGYIGTVNSGDLSFSTGAVDKLRVGVDGTVEVITPARIGYGTGAGGSVAQATGKGTSVTLNRPTGQITMHSSSLAAGAVVSSIVNNSLLSVSDTIVVSLVHSVNSANYQVWAGVGGGGNFILNLKNISTGALAESVVVNFSIIKGSAS